jgi:putative ABC transport system ATP-binding protein
MSKIITLKDVTKTLGTVRAVRDVSLEVEKGKFLAIQGPSGSGKSTLLGIIAGLERPDEGEIIIDGQDITSMTEDQLSLFRRYNIGFVFQAFNLIPTLNAIENIAFPLFPERISRKEMLSKAQKAAEEVGLSGRLTHYPGELSAGEQQRVAVARSLINNPGVILADEPTGNLDSETGKRIIELLRKLNKEKQLTFILVTHDDKIAAVSDDIIRLVDGKIINEKQDN